MTDDKPDNLAAVRGLIGAREPVVVQMMPAEDGQAADPAPMPEGPASGPPGWPAAADRAQGAPAPGETRPPDYQPPPAPDGAEPGEFGPIKALGREGGVYFYLGAQSQIVEIARKDFSQNTLVDLFAPATETLWRYFPRTNKNGEPTGWNFVEAREALMNAAASKPLWDPHRRLLGPGAWAGANGELIFHCGDMIHVVGVDGAEETRKPGLIDGYVYPAGPPKPRPAEVGLAPAGEKGPAAELLAAFERWNWRRGAIDARLLLGWVGAAMVGGALDWRPSVVVTGDAGEGKSTLHKLIQGLFGDALLAATNATAAALWQHLRYASVPVMLDEAEASGDNRKMVAILELMRQAASGGVVLRGGADHKGQEFTARSAFMFSMILVPPMSNADRTRLAILELDRLEKGADAPDTRAARWGPVGRRLMRRLADGWERLPDVLGGYRSALIDLGHTARGGDTFGTLLALADILMFDSFDRDSAGEICAELAPARIGETAEGQADWRQCFDHLLTSAPDVYRGGEKVTVRALVHDACEAEASERDKARRALKSIGLKVVDRTVKAPAAAGGGMVVRILAVMTAHVALNRLLEGTRWQGGVWTQSLRRAPGSQAGRQRFEGGPEACTELSIALVLGEGE